MGSRWRQENYFRCARMHFDLDSHDAYANTDDDLNQMIPNPAKKKAHKRVLAARAGYQRALARTGSAYIDPRDGFLTVRLDRLPTKRSTTAIAELCEHLTATQTM